jgi:general secretion pathway protein K
MKHCRQQGIALITALLIVTLATTAAVTITSQLQREIRRSGNIMHRDQAYIYALAAEDFARYGLKLDFDTSKNDHLNELWHIIPVAEDIEGGTLEGRLDDLQGLFNLNNLANKKALDKDRFQLLLKNLQFTGDEIQQLTAALLDWLDSDQTSQLSYGAEDDYYQGLSDPLKPYLTANQLLSNLSELKLIKGFSDEILLKLRLTPALDPVSGEVLLPVFTVLPSYTEININTASVEVLKSIDTQITDAIAQEIIVKRDGDVNNGGVATPFESVNDFKKYLEGLSVKNLDVTSLSVVTEYFLLTANTTISHAQMHLRSILKRDNKGVSSVISRSQGVI